MKKEEILAKSRRENLLGDERARGVRQAADQTGHLVLCGLLLVVLVISMLQQWRGATPLVAPWLPVALYTWDEFAQHLSRYRHGSRPLGWPRVELWALGVMGVGATLLVVLPVLEAAHWIN